MKEQNNNTQQPDISSCMEEFEQEQREKVRRLWDQSLHAKPEYPDISEDDVEQALDQVHRRMESSAPSSRQLGWMRYAAAAVIILAAALGYLFYPQSATAPHGEITTVQLPDGSQAELNSGSELWYNRLFGFTNRTITMEGEIYFHVQEGNHPFIVHANEATAKVTGTAFNVRSWEEDPAGGTELAVEEGEVHFYPYNRDNQVVVVESGNRSHWRPSMNRPATPEQITPEQLAGWRNQMLIFHNRPLPAIFNELERRYDVRIEVEVPQLEKESLTTYYNNLPELETVLEDICRVKGLQFAPTANGYRIYR